MRTVTLFDIVIVLLIAAIVIMGYCSCSGSSIYNDNHCPNGAEGRIEGSCYQCHQET